MNINYDDPRFAKPINWIQENILQEHPYEFIKNGRGNSQEDLHSFLDFMTKYQDWDIEVPEWIELVDREFKDSEERKAFKEIQDKSIIVSIGEDNGLSASKHNQSSWQKYRRLLERKNFDKYTIDSIERDSESILRKLSTNTQDSDSIKGLAVGSVQSGKTTNMAALMAMAADVGWNVFIVFSGTIDNLRVQTERRLYNELASTNGNVNWELIEKSSMDAASARTPQNLDFNNNQYLIVTLKQKQRLKRLYKWLISDKAKANQMRILIIDDEADQASVNTSDLTKAERNAINREIVRLVNNENDTQFKSVNYIGYTATPYANVLSESADESLYPKDFIAVLEQSRNYIGPSQIFGVEGEDNYPGMDIVNEINKINHLEFNQIGDIHLGKGNDLPRALKESIAYFIAASASLRLHRFESPVSMLIHTSIKQAHHDNVGKLIQNWLSNETEEVLEISERVWKEQHSKFTIDHFKESARLYSHNIDTTKKPHKFSELVNEVRSILKDVSPITSIEKGEYSYHDGLHISIDNSAYNKIINEDEVYRLLYPTDEAVRNKTPIFLVVGGATLSRGLTLEGLISTYFVRNSGQADTLMQMGRWFGFRIGYELYPRIWMSSSSIDQFSYLADLDFSLRKEIKEHNVLGYTPKDVGIKVKTSPKAIRLKVTSDNKSRGKIESDFDFTGASIQSTIFMNDDEVMESNLQLLTNFIDDLGSPKIIQREGMNSVYWENVEFNLFKDYLHKLKFSERFRMGNNMEAFINWVDDMTEKRLLENWNVIAVGKGEINSPENNWHQKHFSWNTIQRSKVKEARVDDIRIQSLRAPLDLYRDIDISKIEELDLIEMVKGGHSSNYMEVRRRLGLLKTPQIMLYRIDKNSKNSTSSKTREDLNTKYDLAGIYISIPGGVKGQNYVTHLTIKIDANDKLIAEYDIGDD